MNIAYRIYFDLSKCRDLNFFLSDALLVLYLHDLEKPWKYSGIKEKEDELKKFDHYQDFIFAKAKEYGVVLNENMINGIKYVHGEGSDYDPKVRVQSPLAAFVHICDTISARIWFDKPDDRDSW